MTYAVLAHATVRTLAGYSVRGIEREDMEPIRRWRNAQIRVLRQATELSSADQQRYFEQAVLPTFEDPRPRQVLLTLLLEGGRVGYGGLTHIDWEVRRTELAFLVTPERAADPDLYEQDFRAFLTLAIDGVAFADLRLHRVFSETFDIRPQTVAILESFGFVPEGRMRDHVEIDGRYVDSLLHGYVAREPAGRALHRLDRPPGAATRGSVLVTSAGAKVPLLRAVRAALDDVGPRGAAVHAGDVDAFAIGRYFADAFWAMPRLDELPLEQAIAYCNEHGIGLVIPTRDGELPYWAEARGAMRAAGIDVLVPDPYVVQSCLDKLRFAQLLVDAGEPAIRTVSSPDQLDGVERYVVKERFGAGAERLGLDLDRDAALTHAAALEHPVFQPLVRGTEFSVDLYVTRNGAVQGAIARRRELVRHGESQVTATVRDAALEERCGRIAQLIGLRGHAVIQVLIDGASHHIVECNPRFGGASTLGLAAGLQTFVWACLEAREESLASRPFRRAKGERRQVRFAADKILPA